MTSVVDRALIALVDLCTLRLDDEGLRVACELLAVSSLVVLVELAVFNKIA